MSEYPQLPWTELDLLEVHRLENERLIREFTKKLAEVDHEEDRLGGFFGNYLIARGAKHYRTQIAIATFRNEQIQAQKKLLQDL